MFGWVRVSRLRKVQRELFRTRREAAHRRVQVNELKEDLGYSQLAVDHLEIRLENRGRAIEDLSRDLDAAEAVGVEQQGEIESLTNALCVRGRSIDYLVNAHTEAEIRHDDETHYLRVELAETHALAHDLALQAAFWQAAWLDSLATGERQKGLGQ